MTLVLPPRFWAKVEKTATCWLWTSSIDTRWGYGYFWFEGRPRRAHILSYVAHRGPVPNGLDVCHTCDVRVCVNPEHLYAGTKSQNMQDMVARGRRVPHRPRGELGPAAKLTAVQVLDIRARRANGEQQKVLAREFGVSPMTVSAIINRKTWTDL